MRTRWMPLFLLILLGQLFSGELYGQIGSTAFPESKELQSLALLNQTLESLERRKVPWLPAEVASTRSDTVVDFSGSLDVPVQALYSGVRAQSKAPAMQSRNYSEVLVWSIWHRLLYSNIRVRSRDVLSPWLQLRNILRNRFLTSEAKLGRVLMWQSQHPRHPASLIAHDLQIRLAGLHRIQQLKKIAVLLPLTGELSAAGHLVSKGIRIAWFKLKKELHQVPELRFFDSAQEPGQLINGLLAAQIDLIIGPIDKKKLIPFAQQLSEHSLHPKVLLLNWTDDPLPNSKFWQFGLPIEEEVNALARYAYARGIRRVGALIAESNIGLRAGAALEDIWYALGGEWIGTEVISSGSELSEVGRDLLLTNRSQRRHVRLQRIIGSKIEHIPRRRQDLDGLFIAAPGGRGHQITAALAYNYLEGIPLFALSSIYQPQDSGIEFDLESVIFVDMPWMVMPTERLGYPPIYNDHAYRKRLIAFGIDAFNVALRIAVSPLDIKMPYWGVTGILTRDQQKVIWTPAPVTLSEGVLRTL